MSPKGMIGDLLERTIDSEAVNCRRQIPASVLVVTADLGFFSGVLLAACSCEWQAHWARGLNRAIEISRCEHTPVVVFDANLPQVDWEIAFDRLIAISPEQRILLAAASQSEELWREVLKRRGYDIVRRSAGSAELGRAMRFAWLSLVARQ